ncbi:hypothetical protein [Pedobacter sp. V48]|uniref:hypothetical protein n=1 Tax=Pedobacter sp. V48 TaxID=509635 RepID=UPI0003E483C5|nr:hypothetical protein [Pedobacter sp. V48]ETZ20869.1 hypothetical protein N824_29720 [Pedobacter sp. V48]
MRTSLIIACKPVEHYLEMIQSVTIRFFEKGVKKINKAISNERELRQLYFQAELDCRNWNYPEELTQ